MATTINMDAKENTVVNPKMFNLWIALISIVMLFAGLTSAYIVKRAEGGWHQFDLPVEFLYSIGIAVLSSITLQWAKIAARRNDTTQTSVAVLTTIILGIGFCYSQLLGYAYLADNGMNVFFTNDVAASFLSIIAGLHAFHVIGGLVALIILWIKVVRRKVNSSNMLAINMCTIYWHFMGILWIYLYLFLFLNR